MPEQLPVAATRGEQVGMGALFNDASPVQHQDPVGIPNRGEPVRHDDAGATDQCVAETLEDAGLGMRVNRAQRIIQDENRRLLRQGPGNRRALLLPPGQVDAPFAQHGLVAVRQDR